MMADPAWPGPASSPASRSGVLQHPLPGPPGAFQRLCQWSNSFWPLENSSDSQWHPRYHENHSGPGAAAVSLMAWWPNRGATAQKWLEPGFLLWNTEILMVTPAVALEKKIKIPCLCETSGSLTSVWPCWALWHFLNCVPYYCSHILLREQGVDFSRHHSLCHVKS